jgi:2-amino-4-hydroxy-6-hydroxymethyldihydropteridine diphosphokinase
MDEERGRRAWLSLGSNLGPREQNLRAAVRLLSESGELEVVKVSSVYETVPIGFTGQADFLNLVAEVRTELEPHELLRLCLQVEDKMGRVREERWGPRVIDVDVLLYGDEVIDSAELVLPHPEMLKRAFVLVPLLELEPDIRMPDGSRAANSLEALGEEGRAGVSRLKGWEVPSSRVPRGQSKAIMVSVAATLAVCVLAIILAVALAGRHSKVRQMVIETGRGRIVVEMKEDAAPQTCRHMEALVGNGSYEGSVFYSVDEVAALTGIEAKESTTAVDEEAMRSAEEWDSSVGTVADEVGLPNLRGAVAMAKPSDPSTQQPLKDSGQNEFYILKTDAAWLDQDFAVFGYVTGGMDVVDGLGLNQVIDSITLDGTGRYAIIEQSTGNIVIELKPEDGPLTVRHFTDLIESGFYTGMNWYRVEDWVVQTGSHARSLECVSYEMVDPVKKAEEAKTVPAEGKLPAGRGAVLLYWIPDAQMSEASAYIPEYPTEFVIMKQDYSEQLGTTLTVFGEVVEGMDVVDQLQQGDKITSIIIREV